MPPVMNVKTRANFVKLATDIQNGRSFNKKTLKKLAGFETPPPKYQEKFTKGTGESKYFNYLLKKNKAYEDRFNKPYAKK